MYIPINGDTLNKSLNNYVLSSDFNNNLSYHFLLETSTSSPQRLDNGSTPKINSPGLLLYYLP